jgi:hypothetical protein
MPAMAWIKVEHTTPLKPEVLRIARTLGITRDDAFGKVIRFWMWLDAITVDGDVDGLTSQDVDAVVGVSGFANALQSVSWLEIDEQNQMLRVPNFTDHNGESAKLRAGKSKRQNKWRQNKPQKSTPSNVDAATSTGPSTREDKRREEYNPPTPPESGGTVNQPTGLTNGQAEKAKQPTAKELKIEAIYQAYPRKVAKKAALTSIEKALKEATFEELLEATQDYARRTAGAEPSLIPHPATWYNRHGWLDDRRDWDRVGRKTPQNGQPGPGQKYDPNIRLGAW